MRTATLGAVALALVSYASAVAVPFEDSFLEPARRSQQCPRTQKLHAACDNQTKCCKPGYGCNTSGKGSVGQVCVKRETPWCGDDSDCGSGQKCIKSDVGGKQTSFCGLVSPDEGAAKQLNAQPATPKYTPPPKKGAKCSKTYTAKAGQDCSDIIAMVPGLTLADFYRQNPQINNPSCNNIQIGQSYCVQPMSSCMKQYAVKKGDTCIGITKKTGISLSELYRQNPQVNNPSCNNLIPGDKLCVEPGMGAGPSSSLMPSSLMPSSLMPSSMLMPSSLAPSSLMTPGAAQPTKMAARAVRPMVQRRGP